MRPLPLGIAAAVVLLTASEGWRLYAVHGLLQEKSTQLEMSHDRAEGLDREIVELRQTLRSRDREVIVLRRELDLRDQEVAHLLDQNERSRVRDRIELSRSYLSRLAAALEHYFKTNGHYPAALSALVPAYLDAIPAEPCTNHAYLYRPISAPPLDYTLSTGGYPTGSACGTVTDGLSFAPAMGLVNQP
jgi:hypothetical protein